MVLSRMPGPVVIRRALPTDLWLRLWVKKMLVTLNSCCQVGDEILAVLRQVCGTVTHTSVHVYMYTHTGICIGMCVCICTCGYTHIYVYTYIYMYIYICVYAYVYMYTQTFFNVTVSCVVQFVQSCMFMQVFIFVMSHFYGMLS